MNAVMKLYAWSMRIKVAVLSVLLLVSSISGAWAKCYSDECADARIDAFFYLLPLIIWGVVVWANESNIKGNPEKYNSGKKFQIRLMYAVTFVIAWLFMGWMS